MSRFVAKSGAASGTTVGHLPGAVLAASNRRDWLLALAGAAMPVGPVWAGTHADPRLSGQLTFPRDHGAHPEFRTEWWYATGALTIATGTMLGFQVTFFRTRVGEGGVPPSATVGRFEPRQLLFAHAALTDVAASHLWHGQRVARWNGDPAARSARASLDDTAVAIGTWAFERRRDGSYHAQVSEPGVVLDLVLRPTQPLLLQGVQGLSRKGPDPAQASHYYSQPQLAVSGQVVRDGRPQAVTGKAWLDHEWSETLLPRQAVGWDWVGMNLDSGAALTAFRLRTASGDAVWAGGSWREPGGQPRVFAPGEVVFTPLRWWVSPGTQARYPVVWRVATPVGVFEVSALLDAQELDSRASTGTVYWEGLSELLASDTRRRVGLGYLEMTGYVDRISL